jgi:lipopolysaccharide/colanic/teichoic acid biosynthesis glycosyltransferase
MTQQEFCGWPAASQADACQTKADRIVTDPVKRGLDIFVAVLVIVVGAPFMLMIALAIVLDSKGSPIYRQKRHGLNGQVFMVFKFRTMADRPDASCQAARNDPRVTRVGRFLRKSSLDELPQIFNVLLGQMSLVGPRPHPIWLNERFAGLIKNYNRRHTVKPGITGLAQVNGWRGATPTLRTMEQRVWHDLRYVDTRSTLLDLKILALTAVRIWSDESAY